MKLLYSQNKRSNFLIFRFIVVLFAVIPFVGLGQFTMNGSTLNSGDYTCGVSTFTDPPAMADETNYSITICPAAGEVAVVTFGTIVLNNNGGTGSDDVLIVTQGAATLYQDGTGSTGVDNVTVTGTTAGACITITLQVHDNTPNPIVNATIGCLPAANAGVDQNPGDCSTSTVLSANDVSPATGAWSVSPAAGVTFSNVNDPNATASGMIAGSPYTFTWTSSQGGASHSDQMLFNSVGPGCLTYCTPTPAYTSNAAGFISNVNINSGVVNNTTGWASVNPTHATCATLVQGQTFPLSITINYTAGANFANFWIDWNGNGVFEASELTALGSITSAVPPFTQSIAVPCDAAIGTVRMRVAYANAASPDPCVPTTGFGETEDYCLTIVAATVPISDAGPDQNISCTSTTSLDASASVPATGFWTLVSGTGTITTPTSPTSTITGMSNGANVFQWTSVGTCETDEATVTINVSGLPNVPVSAGSDIFSCTQGLALDGSDPAPFAGEWVVISGPNVPVFTPDANTNDAQVSGMINGAYVLEWQVSTISCGILTDQMTFNFGSLPAPNAGSDQTICPTGAVLNANDFEGATGTWSVFSGPVGSGFVDVNDPNTMIYGLVAGSYVLHWSVSGGGCAGGTFDAMTITVNACVTTVTHGTTTDQTFTGCSYTYTDDGGAGANYSNNISQTWTTFCPDDPDAFATLTFNTSSFYPGDYLVVYDEPGVGAPVVAAFFYDGSPGGGPVQSPTLGTTITSSTGCLYVQMNSTATNVLGGFTATVGCSPTVGVQNQDFVTVNNCGGGGGITLCVSGSIPAIADVETNPPDLGNLNSGCLGSQENASNTWVYIVAESDGYIAFQIAPAGGQDFDYAIWGPYDGGYSCPGQTLDDPMRCSWAANGGASCPATIGLGVINTSGGPVSDVSEGGFCSATNEGWTTPILASQGDVYVLLFQNFGYNNSSFDVTINDDPSLIPPGGTFADLGCTPPTPLPVELISFVGENKNRKNYLYWNTASEYNNDYFTIEKSADGKNWSVLTTVPGAGFSTDFKHYSTVDQNPLDGITYYRLLQTDFNGQKRSYKTIAINTEVEIIDQFSNLYPNPTSDYFHFNYGGTDFSNTIYLEMYDQTGKLVKQMEFENFNDSQNMEVETNDIETGMYQVILTQRDHQERRKISIIR